MPLLISGFAQMRDGTKHSDKKLALEFRAAIASGFVCKLQTGKKWEI